MTLFDTGSKEKVWEKFGMTLEHIFETFCVIALKRREDQYTNYTKSKCSKNDRSDRTKPVETALEPCYTQKVYDSGPWSDNFRTNTYKCILDIIWNE